MRRTTTQRIFLVIALMGFLPLVVGWLPMMVIIAPTFAPFLLFGAGVWLLTRRSLYRHVSQLLAALGALIGSVFSFLFGYSTSPSSRYMSLWRRYRLFGKHKDGFLIDGHKKRVSSKTSFESIVTVGGMGRGKSSIFVMPNLFTITQGSFVISDTSGEIYQKTSGYLKQQGFNIQVLNLMDPTRSDFYNPLYNVNSFTDISQTAHTLIQTAFPDAKDPFWNAGSEKILRILLQCLHNTKTPEHKHLASLKHLLANFDLTPSTPQSLTAMDRFVLDNTQNDPALFQEYRSFLAGNQKTMQAILMSAEIALNAIGNPDLATLTSQHTLDFSQLKKRKTAIYILAKQQDLSYFEFLLNLFYTDLFRTLLSSYDPSHLPVYLLLDEFGHLQLNNFDVVITTARKYKIGIWIFLQSLSQLESRYGVAKARTILDGLQTEIYLPGQNLDVAQRLAQRLGHNSRGGRPLMTADQIISMKDKEALFFYSNYRPLKVRTKPYYKQFAMRRKSNLPAAELPHSSLKPPSLVQI